MISWRIRKDVTCDTGALINRLVYGLRKLGTEYDFRNSVQCDHESEDIRRAFRRSIRVFGVALEGCVGPAFVPLRRRKGRLGPLRRWKRGIRLPRRKWLLGFIA